MTMKKNFLTKTVSITFESLALCYCGVFCNLYKYSHVPNTRLISFKLNYFEYEYVLLVFFFSARWLSSGIVFTLVSALQFLVSASVEY